jgi:hydroxymethylpyrimidine pyrophosphatase-like HAD family hydrolase
MSLPSLVATDLDGTLVRSDDTVSAYTYGVLDRVRAAGIPVVGVTGRGPRILELTRYHLPSASHMVMAGGGWVFDLTGPTPVTRAAHTLDGPSVAALLDELEAVVGRLIVAVEAIDGTLLGELHPEWPWPVPTVAMSRVEMLSSDVIKAVVRADGLVGDELLIAAQRVIPASKATLTEAMPGYLEINPPGVDKATGLALVATALGVDPAGVLVFGDMLNDVPMFQWAGWRRVAVGNAHPVVRALADEITLTNDEDGVAAWLDRLLTAD